MKDGTFSSRWGTMLAMLGMAVGTGNIWRFPKEAAANGGGSFLVAWVVFLLLWSVPLILVEFAVGKSTRSGPVGALAKLTDGEFTWMGAFVAFTATAIMFYYSVVMGWTIKYLWGSITTSVPMASAEAARGYWNSFAGTPWAIVTHVIAMGLAGGVVWKGVQGIERAAKVLIPSLFVLVVVLAVRAVTLPGATAGLEFLFQPQWGDLISARLWIEALTQNAWDTGAGWGLIVAYAVYLRKQEDTALNSFLLGFGNNSVSLLAGIMVLCTAFSVLPADVVQNQVVGATNTGLTFIWVPQLFGQIPAGEAFMVLFFLALMFAAWSSLISMVELASRVLTDVGIDRKKAIGAVVTAGLVLGLPSALSMDVFTNQDTVWGIGLILSGLFFALTVTRYGVDRFRREIINSEGADITIGRWWNWVIQFVVVEAVILLGWWLWQAVDLENLAATFTPFSTYSVGTILLQWAVPITVFLALNGWLYARTSGAGEEAVSEATPAG